MFLLNLRRLLRKKHKDEESADATAMTPPSQVNDTNDNNDDQLPVRSNDFVLFFVHFLFEQFGTNGNLNSSSRRRRRSKRNNDNNNYNTVDQTGSFSIKLFLFFRTCF